MIQYKKIIFKVPSVIEKIIFARSDGGPGPYIETLPVVPKVRYGIKVEVLLNDLSDAEEKVSSIELNGIKIGECNPESSGCTAQGLSDCGDHACVFYDCTPSLDKTLISFDSSAVNIKLVYVGHSRDCDCNTNTWECKAEDVDPTLTPTLALARITFTAQGIIHFFDLQSIFCHQRLELKNMQTIKDYRLDLLWCRKQVFC